MERPSQYIAMSNSLNGHDLRRAFIAGTKCLELRRDALNSLNVFPVPDGDTGTNMLLTMRMVNEETQHVTGSSVSEYMRAAAKGALFGARGNSGVILSQFLNGLAQGLQHRDSFDGRDFAEALAGASKLAKSAVGKPEEGTMLTVIEKASLAATKFIDELESSRQAEIDPIQVWEVALDSAKIALEETPLQLKVLAEAGVVDAGGQGIVFFLEGGWCELAGGNITDLELNIASPEEGTVSNEGSPVLNTAFLDSMQNETFGYCTQFLIKGSDLEPDNIKNDLLGICESVVVIGSQDIVRIHAHAIDPGCVVSYGVGLGIIDQVNIANMDEQHDEFVGSYIKDQKSGTKDISIVSVVSGSGFMDLFHSLGCTGLIVGGQTMNPNTQELVQGAIKSGCDKVIVLPNNKNIIASARQAISIADQMNISLYVVPTETIPQGIAALLAFDPDVNLDTNLRAMNESKSDIKSFDITTAVRSTTIGGMKVRKGQYIGILDGDLIACADTMLLALEQTIQKADPQVGQLVTLYWGQEIGPLDVDNAACYIRSIFKQIEVQTIQGGQPVYPLIGSLE